MEQHLHSPEVYDYRQYDRIWQRVAPNLEPYPEVRRQELEPAVPAAQMNGMPAATESLTPAQVQQEAQLPGAEMNPCCMGSAAAEMLEVLTGFIEEELADRRYLQAMVRQAPSWARQRLRDLAASEGAQAKRLMAAYYLITGECYRPNINCDRIYVGRWCPALRERYHAAACNALNYARAADGTTDPCLSRLLNELSAGEYGHANELMSMLERSLQG